MTVYPSAKSTYAIRAALVLGARTGQQLSAHEIAAEQDMPVRFLETILADLRRARIVRSNRGNSGGYSLTAAPNRVALGAIIRAVDGPLVNIAGLTPNESSYVGSAANLTQLWVAVEASLRDVYDGITIADVLSGAYSPTIRHLLKAAGDAQPVT